jgi:hypothetical protein
MAYAGVHIDPGCKNPVLLNKYRRNRNFSGDLILVLLARVLRLLKLNIANNSFQTVDRLFSID